MVMLASSAWWRHRQRAARYRSTRRARAVADDKMAPVIVLGISETHCATAAILRDGEIVGCASEERFSRLKNDAGYPRQAVDALLRELRLTAADIDVVALAGLRAYSREWMNRVLHDAAYARAYYGVGLHEPPGLPRPAGSLGSFYSFVTLLLGMKFGEHEYKVMGLAPYASAGATERAAQKLREVFELDAATPARFVWKRRGRRYQQLLEATLGLRFDAIAGGAQRLVEETLLAWTRLMHARYGGERLALGGGVFMNVKANMLIAEDEWVRDLFVFPSCGDESNAIGAAYLGYLDLCRRRGTAATPRPFGPAYLGPDVADADVEAVIRGRDLATRHRVSEPARIEEKIADLLVSDGVVARCAGRMEFGARALGNRSILANPADPRVVTLINRMIKNRDFWMPFAPSILRERESRYLGNPQGLASPYMMLAFPTNPKRRDEIVAAVHPHDGTARAHILDETWNPGYHRVIREFERRTGIGAVLNTSVNLHGEPLVGSAADAIDTFERSGLPHLALGRFLISKK